MKPDHRQFIHRQRCIKQEEAASLVPSAKRIADKVADEPIFNRHQRRALARAARGNKS